MASYRRRARRPAARDLPALAARRSGPRCAARWGSRIARRAGAAMRSPSTTGRTARAPRRCSRFSPTRACARPSSSSASRCGATRRSLARSSRPVTGSGCTATATATSCVSRRGRCARTSPGRSASIEDATGHSPTLYRPPYGILNASALRDGPRTRLADAAVDAVGSRLGGARHARVDRRARHRRRASRARCCCCTTPTTTPRRAPGGAPSRRCRGCSMRWRERGLESVAL